MSTGETSAEAFDRGHIAGEIARTLTDHAAHLSAINGSTEKTAVALEAVGRRLESMSLQLQRLADQAESDAATRVATAAALKDADEARRHTAERTGLTVSRATAVIGAGIAVATLALGLYLALRPR